MTPFVSQILKTALRTEPRIGVVFRPDLCGDNFPGYLTSTCLRVIADAMDKYQRGPAVQVNSMEEVAAMADHVPEGWPERNNQ